MKNTGSVNGAFWLPEDMDCRAAEKRMSSFIDSMASPVEVERLEAHVAGCAPCQRQLQGYVSVKNLMRGVEEPAVPPDLVLETRVRLSHERNSNRFTGLETRLSNSFTTLAIPALAGICFTIVFFGVLLGALLAPAAIASDHLPAAPSGLYQKVRTTDPTLRSLAGNAPRLETPLTVDILVGETGRMIDYTVVSGPSNPEIDRWLREILYFADFVPANLFGQPVESRFIFSFVDVTS